MTTPRKPWQQFNDDFGTSGPVALKFADGDQHPYDLGQRNDNGAEWNHWNANRAGFFLNSCGNDSDGFLEKFRSLIQLLNGLAQFIDSTIYAGWSSVHALSTVLSNFRQLYANYLTRVFELIQVAMRYIRMNLNENKIRTFEIGMVVTLIVLLGRILNTRSYVGSSYPVRFQYLTEKKGHLSLKVGEFVKIFVKDAMWAFGENSLGERGCFPLNHIAV